MRIVWLLLVALLLVPVRANSQGFREWLVTDWGINRAEWSHPGLSIPALMHETLSARIEASRTGNDFLVRYDFEARLATPALWVGTTTLRLESSNPGETWTLDLEPGGEVSAIRLPDRAILLSPPVDFSAFTAAPLGITLHVGPTSFLLGQTWAQEIRFDHSTSAPDPAWTW